ncbi:YceK/YidQ family lipoprotein [Uliginosibacterium paludis]|uniref:YceK/YidQ family lipoprotein n=1 Tax=Uliginosibacterium paludis TaxID=1615952 RepID=A0ABV2CUS6_9RHOO
MIKKTACIAFSLLLSGCSSLAVHSDGFGYPYAGAEKSITQMPCAIGTSGAALFIPVPFILADLPLSAVLDTLLLPFDLVVTSKEKRQEVVGLKGCS